MQATSRLSLTPSCVPLPPRWVPGDRHHPSGSSAAQVYFKSRNSRRKILPTVDFGRASTNFTTLGTL